MDERSSAARPTAEFLAISWAVGALLETLDHRDRAVFGMALMNSADEAEAETLTDDDAKQAVAWVRAVVAEIARTPKVA